MTSRTVPDALVTRWSEPGPQTAAHDPAAAPAPESITHAARLWPAVEHLIDDTRPAEREALSQRLSDLLSALFEARCAVLATARLSAAPAAVRDSLLQAHVGQVDAVGRLLASLHPAEAIKVLSATQDEADRALVRSFLASPEASLREAALDGQCASGQDHGLVIERLDHECLVVLRAGLARLGLDSVRLNQAPEPEHQTSDTSDESMFLAMLQRGAERVAIGCLARAALVDETLVENAIAARDPRALVSLAWKAGYSMQAATRLQTQLAGIPPASALRATATGACPLGRGEMAWQLREMDPKRR